MTPNRGKAGGKGRAWAWPHQLERPRTGWISYTWWAFKISFIYAPFRDFKPPSVWFDLWDWLSPFQVRELRPPRSRGRRGR